MYGIATTLICMDLFLLILTNPHGAHRAVPVSLAKVPAAHSSQVSVPSRGCCVPKPHAAQVLEKSRPSAMEPAEQAVQLYSHLIEDASGKL